MVRKLALAFGFLLFAGTAFAYTPPQTCPAHNWFSAFDPIKPLTCTQPSFSDLLGTLGTGQFTATTCTNQFVSALSNSGTGTCSTVGNAALAGPLVNGVTIGAGGDFSLTKSDPLAVGNETLTPGTVTKVNGNTPGVAAVAHKFVTTIDTSARGTLAQPATTDLSDVSTGTWTPTIQGDSTAGIVTYTLQNGYYFRVGAQVSINFCVNWSAFSGAVGNLNVASLPFTIGNLTNNFPQGSIGDFGGLTLAAGKTFLNLEGEQNTTVMQVIENGSGVASSSMPVSGAANSGGICGSLVYRTQ